MATGAAGLGKPFCAEFDGVFYVAGDGNVHRTARCRNGIAGGRNLDDGNLATLFDSDYGADGTIAEGDGAGTLAGAVVGIHGKRLGRCGTAGCLDPGSIRIDHVGHVAGNVHGNLAALCGNSKLGNIDSDERIGIGFFLFSRLIYGNNHAGRFVSKCNLTTTCGGVGVLVHNPLVVFCSVDPSGTAGSLILHIAGHRYRDGSACCGYTEFFLLYFNHGNHGLLLDGNGLGDAAIAEGDGTGTVALLVVGHDIEGEHAAISTCGNNPGNIGIDAVVYIACDSHLEAAAIGTYGTCRRGDFDRRCQTLLFDGDVRFQFTGRDDDICSTGLSRGVGLSHDCNALDF